MEDTRRLKLMLIGLANHSEVIASNTELLIAANRRSIPDKWNEWTPVLLHQVVGFEGTHPETGEVFTVYTN